MKKHNITAWAGVAAISNKRKCSKKKRMAKLRQWISNTVSVTAFYLGFCFRVFLRLCILFDAIVKCWLRTIRAFGFNLEAVRCILYCCIHKRSSNRKSDLFFCLWWNSFVSGISLNAFFSFCFVRVDFFEKWWAHWNSGHIQWTIIL